MTLRNYKSAIRDLNSLQSNASIIKEINANRNQLFKNSIPEMVEYLKLIGYKPEHLDKLNIIHITGTKGKGSTAAFCQSILKEYSNGGLKTGLFTSPHMVEVRERIRINGRPLEADKFSRYFYECYDRLVGIKKSAINPHLPGPSYFRFLTLLAFHAFMQEKVDATILEVGIGGEYDSTNVIVNPIVCGISHLGLDHTNLLGNTIQDIAWHKAGIMKSGAPCYTVDKQQPNAMNVLKNRAEEKKVELKIVKPLNTYRNYDLVKLGLTGDHQLENASLAVELAHNYIKKVRNHIYSSTPDILPDFTLQGLAKTRWPGRSQRYVAPNGIAWYLDGAHTTDSLQACIKWFRATYNPSLPTYLLFNPANGRDAKGLLDALLFALKDPKTIKLNGVLLCPNIVREVTDESKGNDSFNNTVNRDPALLIQNELKEQWIFFDKGNLLSKTEPEVFPSITKATESIISKLSNREDKDPKIQVLVTGSLHLVGGVMEAIDCPVE